MKFDPGVPHSLSFCFMTEEVSDLAFHPSPCTLTVLCCLTAGPGQSQLSRSSAQTTQTVQQNRSVLKGRLCPLPMLSPACVSQELRIKPCCREASWGPLPLSSVPELAHPVKLYHSFYCFLPRTTQGWMESGLLGAS